VKQQRCQCHVNYQVLVLQLGALCIYRQELQRSTTPSWIRPWWDGAGYMYKDSTYPLSLTLPFNCNHRPRFNLNMFIQHVGQSMVPKVRRAHYGFRQYKNMCLVKTIVNTCHALVKRQLVYHLAPSIVRSALLTSTVHAHYMSCSVQFYHQIDQYRCMITILLS
jgi:hypothetical protein